MQIGFVGLGKLGLPVALSIENKGHNVVGYDVDPNVEGYIKERSIPYVEVGTPELLKTSNIKHISLDEVVSHSEIVFCPVQTPHNELYEGITRLPDNRVDFDYSYLKEAVQAITDSCVKQNKRIILIIISTVLPGTIEREILPWLDERVTLCYNPFFIAMGTTRADFENPEFVLLGSESAEVARVVEDFYKTIHNKPVFTTSIRNAELIKVVYNTFISTKISFITAIQELCHRMGCNIDQISEALFLATDRIISPKYLRGGMPDGGGCHPRDNIALSWVARTQNMSYDWFENIMLQRERTIDWYADLIQENLRGLPVIILGKAFKKDINLVVGSPAVLLGNVLDERGIEYRFYDHLTGDTFDVYKALYFVGTNHSDFEDASFPAGSVVLDPWGIINDQWGVEVIRIGR